MHIGLLITKHISDFLYYAHGKWYFIFWFGMAGLNQAEWADFSLEVSLSSGTIKKMQNMICDQEAYVHLWWNSRIFWFLRLTLMLYRKVDIPIAILHAWIKFVKTGRIIQRFWEDLATLVWIFNYLPLNTSL